MRKKRQCQLLACCCCMLAATAAAAAYTYCENVTECSLFGVLVCIQLLSTIFWLDISKMNPADSHSFATLITQYLITRLLTVFGRRQFLGMVAGSKNPAKVQENLLLKITQENACTSHGNKYQFHVVKSRAQFVSMHPLTQYSFYKPYMDRILSGERQVLTRDNPVYLALSSGTTGKSKVIPITKDMRGPRAKRVGSLMYYQMARQGGLDLHRVLILSYKQLTETTQCGLQKGTASAHMTRYVPFVVSPKAAYDIPDEPTSLHIHAVFGLRERQLGHIEALMTPLVHSFWSYIRVHWQQICQDIRHGALWEQLKLHDSVRRKLNKSLRPDALRADQLFEEFGIGFDRIAKRVWPGLRFVRMLNTGSLKHTATLLRTCELSGVKQISQMHAASEGFMGVNLSADADSSSYTAMYTYAMMEFIPESVVDKEQPRTLFVEELQQQEKYEVVITTPMGLYRYRTGDIIKVTGFLNKVPVYEFCHRLGHVLNLHTEKVSETAMYEALKRTMLDFVGACLVDYTVTESTNFVEKQSTPGVFSAKHYVLFVEVRHEHGYSEYVLSESQKERFDECLCSVVEMYANHRETGAIGRMRVVQVDGDTFNQLKKRVLTNNNHQFKMPRVMRDQESLNWLMSQQIVAHTFTHNKQIR